MEFYFSKNIITFAALEEITSNIYKFTSNIVGTDNTGDSFRSNQLTLRKCIGCTRHG